MLVSIYENTIGKPARKWRKCISVTGSLRCPSASATHRQTGWGLHQRGWSDDACATLQRRPRHELAWIWTDFKANSVRQRIAGRRAGGKQQPAWCSRKTQDKFAIASMAKKLLHRCSGAHARVHMHFCGESACIHRCCWAPWWWLLLLLLLGK